MLVRLMGAGSLVAGLRQGLTESTRSVRAIAHQVANASTPGFVPGEGGVATPAPVAGSPEAEGVDEAELEATMVRMADEQLRFEATASLLQKIHQQYRAAARER